MSGLGVKIKKDIDNIRTLVAMVKNKCRYNVDILFIFWSFRNIGF